MKRNNILSALATTLFVVLLMVGEVVGQEVGLGKWQVEQLELYSQKGIPTASEVLEKAITGIEEGLFPLEIYPPGYFDRLLSKGDEPMIEMVMFSPGASALTAGDLANMSWILPGTFTMGSPSGEVARDSGEVQHTVTITSPFYIGKYEVTQGEYLDVVGNNPSAFTITNYAGGSIDPDLNRPVENITWQNATNYCGLLTQRELTAGRIPSGWAYRLPTEAEWEYACRAGTTTAFNFGSVIQGGDANFNTHYIYDSSSGETYVPSPTIAYLARTDTVGNYVNNAWGLYDTHGNVWEYCSDWLTTYPSGSTIDPKGPSTGSYKVIRGGARYNAGKEIRSAIRSSQVINFASFSYGFRTVLAPVVPGWYQALTETPTQPTYANCVSKGSGKSNLVVVTHGWINRAFSPTSPEDPVWVDGISNSIRGYLISHNLSTWQVYGYRWINGAWKVFPTHALSNARQEGKTLGDCLGSQGWNHVHLIAHSAGAGLIQAASERIKTLSPSTTVHTTFLDPYVGKKYEEVGRYGSGANWSDHYFSRDSVTKFGSFLTGPFTESLLNHSYNSDVTTLDPNKLEGITKFRSTTTGLMVPCYKTITSHSWPYLFYSNTIAGNMPTNYQGFGFPLSKEGGGWSTGIPNYTTGNTNARVLGTPDPTCTTEVLLEAPSYADTLVDPTQWPTIESTTGTIQKYFDSLKLLSGSPAWVATVVTSTNPINTVSFNARFSSTNGAQGLLSVYWDDQIIGSIDERIVSSNRFTFAFPNAIPNSSHILGFRLDPYTNIQSIVTVTNITLNQVGVSQPVALTMTSSVTNGARIQELAGEKGFDYHVQASTNLVDWTDIAILANTNGKVRFYDQSATNYPKRFYRVIAPY
jgi:formylglycine-generating enzyme required for sulfatase activity